jgi:hypothetical protein
MNTGQEAQPGKRARGGANSRPSWSASRLGTKTASWIFDKPGFSVGVSGRGG